MSATDPIVIVSAKRTPIGNFLGELTSLSAPQLGGHAIKAALAAANVLASDIDEVIMGCVLPAGLGQAPARQAAFNGSLEEKTPCTTINKMCGSGMKAVMQAHDAIIAGSQKIVIAGGMESMSNAPYLLPNARSGYRIGHQIVLDHMMHDGLEDAYNKGQSMGVFAEATAEKYDISREMQDEFAISSVHRAQEAAKLGPDANGIVAIDVTNKKTTSTVDSDQGPRTARTDKIPQLRPAFKKEGSVTAANASSISDGAAALLLMRQSEAKRRQLTPLATIIAHSTHAQAPAWFTTAPIESINKVMAKTGWQMDDVDLFEINEAFAVVTLAAMQQLNIPHEKVNIFGGACVVGHPIGTTGARILVTLLHALKQRSLKKGIASLCIGGGEATAVAIELT